MIYLAIIRSGKLVCKSLVEKHKSGSAGVHGWEVPFQVGQEPLLATVCFSLEATLKLQTVRHLLVIYCPVFAVLIRPRVLVLAENYISYCKHVRRDERA